MSLPLDIFDDQAARRSWRLSAISAIDSIYAECNDYMSHQHCRHANSGSRTQSCRMTHGSSSEMRGTPAAPVQDASEHFKNYSPVEGALPQVSGTYHDVFQHVQKHSTASRILKTFDAKVVMDGSSNGLGMTGNMRLSTDLSMQDDKPSLPPWHPTNNPDGGWRAWLSVAGSWCGLFVSFGWISCMRLLHQSPVISS